MFKFAGKGGGQSGSEASLAFVVCADLCLLGGFA